MESVPYFTVDADICSEDIDYDVSLSNDGERLITVIFTDTEI